MSGFVVAVLVVAVLVVVVVVIVVVLWRHAQQQGGSPPAPDPLRRDARGIDPRQLSVGSVVHHEGRDFLVRGTLSFDEDGFRWQEHLLDDASGRRWLSVEDDEELELVMWDRLVAPELTPGAPRLTYGDVEYALDEHGNAAYTATGATGTPASGTAEYYDYAAGDRRLSFERYAGVGWEVATGEVINERTLDIYPSSPDA